MCWMSAYATSPRSVVAVEPLPGEEQLRDRSGTEAAGSTSPLASRSVAAMSGRLQNSELTANVAARPPWGNGTAAARAAAGE